MILTLCKHNNAHQQHFQNESLWKKVRIHMGPKMVQNYYDDFAPRSPVLFDICMFYTWLLIPKIMWNRNLLLHIVCILGVCCGFLQNVLFFRYVFRSYCSWRIYYWTVAATVLMYQKIEKINIIFSVFTKIWHRSFSSNFYL